VPVRLSVPSAVPVTVEWTTVYRSEWGEPGALPGVDYEVAGGQVTFAPGETERTVPVTVVGDGVDETDELLVVSFHHPTNALMGGFWGLGFGGITDDDPSPTVLPGEVTVLEGDVGTHVMAVPVTLSGPSARTVTVAWTTVYRSEWGEPGALPGVDYEVAGGQVTFAPGETEQTVPVTVVGDGVDEIDELLVVSFHHPTNALMGGFWGLGFGGITDDD
jgi:hypothetical protein